MSLFHDTIEALEGKDAYVLLAGTPTQVHVVKVAEDLVVLQLAAPIGGAQELTVHLQSILLVSG